MSWGPAQLQKGVQNFVCMGIGHTSSSLPSTTTVQSTMSLIDCDLCRGPHSAENPHKELLTVWQGLANAYTLTHSML
jgi:hypothetical protein